MGEAGGPGANPVNPRGVEWVEGHGDDRLTVGAGVGCARGGGGCDGVLGGGHRGGARLLVGAFAPAASPGVGAALTGDGSR